MKGRPAENEAFYVERIEKYNGTGDAVVVTSRHTPDVLLPYHTHDFYEINFVQSGEGQDLIEGETLLLRAGDLVLLHPETMHTLYAFEGSRIYNFLVSIEWMDAFSSRLSPGDHPLLRFLESARTPEAFPFFMLRAPSAAGAYACALMDTFDAPERAMLREALMTVLLLSALRETDNAVLARARPPMSPQIKKIETYMNAYCDVVDLGLVAQTFHYTKSHVCKLFRTQTGRTFTQALNDIRLRKAKTFLAHSDKPLSEIAHACGIDSVEYFHRLFRRGTGLTPAAYRQMAREQGPEKE